MKTKIHVLDLGKLVMIADNPVTKEEGTAEKAPEIPIHAFLLQTPVGKILFDTGCHPMAMESAWQKEMCANPYVFSPEQTLVHQLDKIGVKPEDINYVVASHLHLDHGGGIHLFPNAEVYVQKEELEKTLEGYEKGTLDVFHQPCDVQEWAAANVKWKPVSSAQPLPLCEGIQLLDLGAGHSFGMLALCVEAEKATYLLVSDAVYSALHYGPPAELAGVVYEEKGYFQTIERIREYAEERDAVVLYGHDMAQYRSLDAIL